MNTDYNEPTLHRPCKDPCGFDCGVGVHSIFLKSLLESSYKENNRI